MDKWTEFPLIDSTPDRGQVKIYLCARVMSCSCWILKAVYWAMTWRMQHDIIKNEDVGKQFENLSQNQLPNLRIISMEFYKKDKIEQIISAVKYKRLQKKHQFFQIVKNINE